MREIAGACDGLAACVDGGYGTTHCTCAMADALPLKPTEHDGRLFVQLGIPMPCWLAGQMTGTSTPVQLVQVPLRAIQVPAKAQLENPVTLVMVQ